MGYIGCIYRYDRRKRPEGGEGETKEEGRIEDLEAGDKDQGNVRMEEGQ